MKNMALFSTKHCLSAVFTFFFLTACSEQQPAPVQTSSTAVAEQTSTAKDPEQIQNLAMLVDKDPNCGCCVDWIKHMQAQGYDMETVHPENLSAIKTELNISPDLRSCHTAVTQSAINGKQYLFEGHVPAKYVQQFLANPPEGAIGLSVPAMPVGTPGMEMGDKFMPYQIIILNDDGSRSVYAQIADYQQQFNHAH
jgi:hypothetical protein